MAFDMFDEPNILGGLKEYGNDFFTSVDVDSIVGRNLVLNFIKKIELEIKMLDFSETSMDLIDFYEYCKKNTSVFDFFNNSVVKMIQEEIENNNTVKKYLNERLFDLIQEDVKKYLQKLYNNSEQLEEEIKSKNQEYILLKTKEEKKIKKIQKQYNCSYEEAVKKNKANELMDALLPSPVLQDLGFFQIDIPCDNKKSQDFDLKDKNNKEDLDKPNEEGFWT